jgi:uncharacterized membrane protein YphA (DoxX/SURF4 family)
MSFCNESEKIRRDHSSPGWFLSQAIEFVDFAVEPSQVLLFFSRGDGTNLHVLLAALGVSLVMLGPGAWSLDARLFGRRRIDVR